MSTTTTTPKPLTFNDYLWIVGIPLSVIVLLPLVAVFGAFLQMGFLVLMPVVVVGTLAHAFVKHTPRPIVPAHAHLRPRHG